MSTAPWSELPLSRTVYRSRTPPAECRAGWTRHLLGGLAELAPPLRARVLSAVPLQHRRKMEESIVIRWLPFEVHMAVLHALRSTLGARAYQQYCAARVAASLHNPAFFAKPARAAMRLYRVGPFSGLRALPPSLRYIFRNAGELRVQVAPDGHAADIFYEGFMPRFSGGDTWSLIWSGSIEALAAFSVRGSALQAHVTLTGQDAERGHFAWHVHTSPK